MIETMIAEMEKDALKRVVAFQLNDSYKYALPD